MVWLERRGKEIVVEMPEEWRGVVPSKVFFDNAREIVEKAKDQGVTLRVIGGVAIRLHSSELADFGSRLQRLGAGEQEFSDLDFVGYKKQRKSMKDFFESIGYRKRVATLGTASSERQIYFHPKGWLYADVFFDKLIVANHPISFVGRLELDFPTITVSDLLLEKLQVWQSFSEKDLKDALLLLRAHEIGEKEGDVINADYIAKLLADDWGFWYTATTNLRRMKELIERVDEVGEKASIPQGALGAKDREDIITKIGRLLDYIDREDKSWRWRVRSKVGTKRRWYSIVETDKTVGFGYWAGIKTKEE